MSTIKSSPLKTNVNRASVPSNGPARLADIRPLSGIELERVADPQPDTPEALDPPLLERSSRSADNHLARPARPGRSRADSDIATPAEAPNGRSRSNPGKRAGSSAASGPG
jgi:hypothetical protein